MDGLDRVTFCVRVKLRHSEHFFTVLQLLTHIYMEDDLKTISAVFFHLIMVLCDGLSANHAKELVVIATGEGVVKKYLLG